MLYKFYTGMTIRLISTIIKKQQSHTIFYDKKVIRFSLMSFLFCIQALSPLLAQNAEVKFSDTLSEYGPSYLGNDPTSLSSFWSVIQKENGKVEYFQKLDSSGHKIYSRPLNKVPGVEGTASTVSILQTSGQLMVLSEVKEKRNHRKSFYLFRLSTNGEVTSDIREVFSGDMDAFGFRLFQSPNEKSIMVSIKTGRRKNIDNFLFLLFDFDLHLVATKNFSNLTDKDLEYLAINNLNKVLLTFDKVVNRRRAFDIRSFDFSSNDSSTLTIDLEGNHLQNLTVNHTADGTIFLTGFYQDQNDQYFRGLLGSSIKPRPYTGIYVATMNDSLNRVCKVTLAPLPVGIEKLPSNGFELRNTRLECHPRTAGGFVLLEEKYFMSDPKHFTYGDILVVDVSETGGINFFDVVPKRQTYFLYGPPDWQASFHSWYDNTHNKLFIVSNVMAQNLRNSVPYLFMIDQLGVTKETSIRSNEEGVVLLPMFSGDVFKDKNQVAVIGIQRKGKLVRSGVLRVN